MRLPDRHAQIGRMEYSKIEEREKAHERRSINRQSGIVVIVNRSKHFC